VGSYVSIPDSPSLDAFTSSITIEAWVKVNEFTSWPGWDGIVTKGNTSWRLARSGLDSTIAFSTDGLSNWNLAGNKDINDGQWHHVAGIYDGTNKYIYVDGVLDVSAPATGTIAQNSYPVCIGENAEAPGHLWNGLIDEASIYNRALTASEIQAIYNAGRAGKCAGPLPPEITVPPVNQTTVGGSNVVLSVDATGTGPFSYQWSFNGTNISGATSATLTLTNLHPYQSGCYAVTITTPYGSITSSCATVTVIAQNILIYKYTGIQKIITSGLAFSHAYVGQMFFIPDSTNGTFVGWGTIKGKKQYWVTPLSDYLLITIPGVSNQIFTVLGQAGQGIDTNGYPNIWSDLHKGKNALLAIGQNKYFSFPNTFANDATQVYPDPQTGKMVLSESSSMFVFMAQNTQHANNTGQTMTDLVNALTKSLAIQGYQKQ
jgi:hypothetical protein